VSEGGYVTGQEAESDTGTARGNVELADRLKALAGHDRGAFEIKIRPEDQPKGSSAYEWPGMSGAAVFAGERLVGVVTGADEVNSRHRLRALPVSRLFRQEQVAAALKLAELTPPVRARSAIFEDYGKEFTEEFNHAPRVVGRGWVLDQIRDFCASRRSGYFLIEAGGGMGKTALAARIARDLDAAAYFFSAREGRSGLDACLQHLAADLIDRFDLRHDKLPAKAAKDWDFIKECLLKEASAKLGGSRPLLLVLDSWDEASLTGLPDSLPAGTFVCVTGRALATPVCRSGTDVKWLRIEASDKRQEDDVAAFLQERVQDPLLRERLRRASQGNFLYLAFVLEDLDSNRSVLNTNSLPQGLRDYYIHIWDGIRAAQDRVDWETWDHLLRPAIALLAAAREPVSAAWVAGILKRDPREVEERGISRWLRYLKRRKDNGALRYAVIHQTFADFLVEERGADVVAAHAQIVAAAFTLWGSLDRGLPALGVRSLECFHRARCDTGERFQIRCE
jgi:hypothetical protein